MLELSVPIVFGAGIITGFAIASAVFFIVLIFGRI